MESDLERMGMDINRKQREEFLKEQRKKQILKNVNKLNKLPDNGRNLKPMAQGTNFNSQNISRFSNV